MNSKIFRGLIISGTGIFLCLFTVPAMAAEFPSRPVTLICPYSAGGPTDMCLRVLAESFGKEVGQPVVVENKTGGAGTVGPATMAATAKPDGYTISWMGMPLLRYPHMMKVSWDPLKDFTYIIQISGWVYGVVVKADAPWKTWNEFIAYAKANPGKVTYGTAGVGGTHHVTMEKIAKKEGLKWILVPQKGAADCITALLGDHVTAVADTTVWAPMVNAGQLRLLVTFGNQRTKNWPDVPTLKELGYNIVATSPWGIAGPKGMDPKVVKILHNAFKKAMDGQAYQTLCDNLNIELFYLNSEDYTKVAPKLYEEERITVENLGLKKK